MIKNGFVYNLVKISQKKFEKVINYVFKNVFFVQYDKNKINVEKMFEKQKIHQIKGDASEKILKLQDDIIRINKKKGVR